MRPIDWDALVQLTSIPTGMTCKGVHRAVIEQLLLESPAVREGRMLDIPCGNADLVRSLRRFFPHADVHGCDLTRPATLDARDFASVDASRPFDVFLEDGFDGVLSMSGVMEFDDTLQFVGTCRRHLEKDGLLIVSNDNVVAMRDRILYLFLGKTRRFQMFVDHATVS